MLKEITINFPPQFKIVYLIKKDKSKSFFYCYNKIYYFKFSFKKIVFNENFNSFTFSSEIDYFNNFEKKFFKKFLKSLDSYFFLKIKFKGKGYKIKYKKKKKLMKFFFNRSHKTLIKYKKIILKKNMKYKFILKSPNIEYLNNVAKIVTNVRPLNIFTNRGLRKSRFCVGKRKGKKGSYI